MSQLVGFTCRYTPLPLIHAAGLVPFRILPLSAVAEQAGSILHDNLCPHVKRVLDRALSDDLPELCGVVIMASCDAMRRLADALQAVRPRMPVVVVHVPVSAAPEGVDHFTSELQRLCATLESWGARPIDGPGIIESVRLYEALAAGLARFMNDPARAQLLANRSVTEAPERVLTELEAAQPTQAASDGVPIYLFGNVLPDPAARELFASCGARIVADDLCTGSRQIPGIRLDPSRPPLPQIAAQLLADDLCARSIRATHPGALAERVVANARATGARGVIAHVVKFCDPYLTRMPVVLDALRAADLPLLVLEGDCSMRSLGQHRTRIEAFVEMLGGSS